MNQTAQGLAALGRGPDTQLVHMAPGEVKSLQQLAMAHGGSLTINPQTGLPEAGFLSSLLPMLIGGALAATGVGAPMAALLVGGGYGAATGSLKKGLMAGLGAYGGAGLGSALAGSGMQAAANTQIAGDATYKAAEETMKQQAATLGQNALPYTPEGFAAQARDLTAPLNTMRDAALTSQQTAFANAGPLENLRTMGSGISNLGSEAGRNAFMGRAASEGVTATGIGGAKGLMQAGMMAAAPMMQTTTKQPEIKTDKDLGQRYQFNAGTQTPTPVADVYGYGNQGQDFGKEQRYFNPGFKQIDSETAKKMYGFAAGGPVEDMSNANAIGMNTGYPQADIDTGAYATPYQQPISRDMLQPQFAGGGSINLQGTFSSGGGQGGASSPAQQTQPFIGSNNAPSMMPQQGVTPMPGADFMPGPAQDPRIRPLPTDMETIRQSMMNTKGLSSNVMFAGGGGISHLGDYSDGGRLLRGPGDGISDSIPAMIGKKQPARLADGEFVVPARIVSELGNGSTEAGARKLYAMMDRVQKARGKTVGKGKVAANSRSSKYLPA